MPTTQNKKIDIACKHCGSRDVRRDADAKWNAEAQTWELCAVFDNATCDECGGETSLIEIELEPIYRKGKAHA